MNDGPLARLTVPLRRWWWVIAVLVAVTAVVTVVTMPSPQELAEAAEVEDVDAFQATHLLIRNDAAPSQLSFDLIRLLASQGDLTNRIAQAAGEDVEVADVQAVSFSADPTTGTMSVTATQPTPDAAVRLADTYALQLVAFLDERTRATAESDYARVLERVESIGDELAEVDAQLEGTAEDDPERPLLLAEREGLLNDFSSLRSQERSLEAQLEGQQASFVTLEEPSPVPVVAEADSALPSLRLPGRLWVRLVLVTLAAIAAGVVAVFVIDFLDTRLRTRRQVEDAYGLPVLAELPRRSKRLVRRDPLPALHDPGGASAEVLRALRLSLTLAPTWHLSSLPRAGSDGAIGTKQPVQLDGDPRSIVVSSPLTGDGKSTLVANLAVSLAEGGKRVLVVDCDFRRPAVGELLDIDPGPGLRELATADERPLLDLATPTIARNVAMVRSGSRGVTPPWFMAQAATLVANCREVADVVIFDTGPITLTNEAAALLPHVDTSLLVVRAGRSTAEQARQAIEQFTQVSAHVSGIVLVATDSSRKYGYYGPDKPRRARSGQQAAPVAARSATSRGGDVWSSADSGTAPSNGAEAIPPAVRPSDRGDRANGPASRPAPAQDDPYEPSDAGRGQSS